MSKHTIESLTKYVTRRRADAVEGIERFAREIVKSHRAIRYEGLNATEHSATIETCDTVLAAIGSARGSIDIVLAFVTERVVQMACSPCNSTNPIANVHEAAQLACFAAIARHFTAEE